MIPDPKHPETLLTVSTEIEAAAIVTALAEYDVEALTVGGYTSGFKAEAPGNVAVVVKLADFDRAKQALTEIQAEGSEIDWSKVDVTESPEAQPPVDEIAPARSNWAANTLRLVLLLWLVAFAVSFVVCLFIRPNQWLVQVIGGILLLGIFLGLPLLAFRRRGGPK